MNEVTTKGSRKAKSRVKRHRRVKRYLNALAAAAKGDECATKYVMDTHMPAAVRAKLAKEMRGPSKAMRAAFYKSREWADLRYRTLVNLGAVCRCCGSSARDGAKMRVDHIESLFMAWDRRLDPTNVQILCNLCNWGKGGFDNTDWRTGTVHAVSPDGRSIGAQK